MYKVLYLDYKILQRMPLVVYNPYNWVGRNKQYQSNGFFGGYLDFLFCVPKTIVCTELSEFTFCCSWLLVFWFLFFLLRCTFIILRQCILLLVPAGPGGEAGENRLLSLLLIKHLLKFVLGGISVFCSSPAVASVSLNDCCIQER